MEDLVNYIGNLKLAGRLIHRNLTVFPVLAAMSGEPGYLNMKKALDQGVLRVTENTLGEPTPLYSLINAGKQPVLIVQGEEIPGNDGRMVFNTSFLARPKSETTIPTEVLAPAPVKEIPVLGEESEPSRASSLFAFPADPMVDFVRQFRLIECQVGTVFSVDSQIVGFEAFGHPDTWAEQSRRLVKQYALLAMSQTSTNTPRVPPAMVRRFLDTIQRCEAQPDYSSGLGFSIRLTGKRAVGSALCFGQNLLHITVSTSDSVRVPKTFAASSTLTQGIRFVTNDNGGGPECKQS